MAILVNKTFLCDTDNVDEAYEWTKPTHEKVETYQVGQIKLTNDPSTRPPAPPKGPPLAPAQNLTKQTEKPNEQNV